MNIGFKDTYRKTQVVLKLSCSVYSLNADNLAHRNKCIPEVYYIKYLAYKVFIFII